MQLDREQIEEIRSLYPVSVVEAQWNALCDMALQSLSSAEAVATALGADPEKLRAEAALLPGLREALAWKPNTPQLENAMTYAWEAALRSFIRAIEKNAPSLTLSETATTIDPLDGKDHWFWHRMAWLRQLAKDAGAGDDTLAEVDCIGTNALKAMTPAPSTEKRTVDGDEFSQLIEDLQAGISDDPTMAQCRTASEAMKCAAELLTQAPSVPPRAK